MTRHNVQLEKKAVQDLSQSQQIVQQQLAQGGFSQDDFQNIDNLSERELQQQIKLQQQIQEQYLKRQDQELQIALKDSLAMEQLQAKQASKIKLGQQFNNQLEQVQDLEAALALSKLEHDEREKQIELSEEEQIQQAIKLSQQQQQNQKFQNTFNQNNSNQYQQNNKIQNQPVENQQNQQKPLINSQVKSNQDLLDDDSDDLLSLSDNDNEQDELAPEKIKQEKQSIIQNLIDMDTTSFVQIEKKQSGQKQQQDEYQKPETLEEKLERVKKQREILLAKKKAQRQGQVEEYTQNEELDEKTIQKRKLLYEKINANILDD
ncbi:hypothetical protein PPERSA_04389 [Pseudocohnilembus persalinus]|uniref:Uncharacterized protein n=1 Tax=Pseudocohnilembus persalinus TaxID=266149 RepID=A0A0V0QQJ0_PSEPJ|nr:hypothetical protein PPERSA_04389 [Pseudocohnilembus persalinus]|eukprot:KRX04574.1 hypothetical protein PPERSA_04389 [Pseudocohnilembus persalinus]